MNPVVGIDVSKGNSQGQAFLDRNQPYQKSFRFEHTEEGLQSFLKFLEEIEKVSGVKPAVILEATGHYHQPVVQVLEKQEYLLMVINPLTSQRSKKSHLRKVKTDAIDAFHLGELYYKEEFEPYQQQAIQLLNLKHLTRQHGALTVTYVQTKLQFQSVLDQIFPHYTSVFGNLFSKVSLKILQTYSTPQSVLEAGIEPIARLIQEQAKRSENWAKEKAQKVIGAAKDNPNSSIPFDCHSITLRMLISLLLELQGYLSHLEKEIDTLAQERKEYGLLRSIPGIGDKIAATILSEIGEIERFDHPKKLVAFSGIDPSVFASGKFVATSNRITKRGSKRLRHALFLAVVCGIRKSVNPQLREYYDKKRAEGKPYKVVIIACANKLVRWIYAILKHERAYFAT
jgi:transposase